ncbi:MAG: hypothetical protein K0U74_15450 [Alphaproteobacteria bacterium]|nr:hypothetical protein [Alphaproteobacteria bacterium]
MPPHIFLLAAVGVSLVAGYRLASKFNQKRAERENLNAARNDETPRDLGNLEKDETTGEYRPEA